MPKKGPCLKGKAARSECAKRLPNNLLLCSAELRQDITGGTAGNFGQSRLSDLATQVPGAPTLGGCETDWTFFRDPLLRASEFRFAVQGAGGVFRSPAFTMTSAREQWGLTGIAREPVIANSGRSER